ncbi:MAG: hypothetical protein IPJ08_13475 [Burkholderiales bacterium]|nr:hypothetical protein [Burkholderiales bacterium]
MSSHNEQAATSIALLRAIATRADNERIAELTHLERAFAMTLEGRRLLECVQLGGAEFRLSIAACKMLADENQAVLHSTDSQGEAS